MNLVDDTSPLGNSVTPDSKERDRNIKARKLEQAPWFAKLPPELRNAILSSSQRRAPRAYEERLRRYFESLE